jgi:hypothetical protein
LPIIRKAITNIEKRLNGHDRQIQIAFDALKSLLQPAPVLPHMHYSPDEEKKMGVWEGKEIAGEIRTHSLGVRAFLYWRYRE